MVHSLKKNDSTIVRNIDIATKFKDRLVGLMFRDRIDDEYGLYIPNCRSVHTLFVRFKLDLVWVNKNFEVVKIVKEMNTWRMSSIVFKAYGVVELAPGVIDKLSIRPGDKLKLEMVE